MNFTPVDWNSWERAEVFRHFIRDLRCVMSLTGPVEATPRKVQQKQTADHFCKDGKGR